MSAEKIIFITGTDTSVGKTLLTALLLHHLRKRGARALAVKPFCSGGRGDIRLLQSLQRDELSDAEMNPFYFPEAIAPSVAARKSHKNILLSDVVNRIRTVAKKCDCLLIEGSGGLLVPLGKNYTVADLIQRLKPRVIVAARNRLGTINHTSLTIKHLESIGFAARNLSIVLMSAEIRDLSSHTNQAALAELLAPAKVFSLPFLGKQISRSDVVKSEEKTKKLLAKLVSFKSQSE